MRTGPVAAAAALLALSGCAGGQDDAVRTVATAFAAALAAGDAAAACARLAPLTREELSQGGSCEQALGGAGLVVPRTVAASTRFGRQASVVVEGEGGERDTWYLSRFDGRWPLAAGGGRLLAAGRRPAGRLRRRGDVR